ncbi:MAG: hypothetical protein OCD03_16355 [Hyphomicrobiales bacterium]
MKKRYIFLIVIVLCFGLYKLVYPTYSWNQKLTVTISTPDGDKTGSAVVGARVIKSPRIMQYVGGVSFEWLGEATVVDLGEGRYVFALLGHPIYLALGSFEHLIIPNNNVPRSSGLYRPQTSLYPRFNNIKDIVAVKSRNYFPILVTFDDIRDPASVKLIDPNDLAPTFEEGYSFKEMTLEITNEKVTEDKINLLLAWLSEYSESHYRLNGARCISCPVQMEPLEDYLAPAYFKLGEL